MQNYISLDLSHQKLKTSYSETGDKNLPTMLFVHGNSSSKETFSKQIQSFKNSFHIITVDLPGHGETEHFTSKSYSLERLSEFLSRFVAKLGLEVHILFGHSLGGHICLQSLNDIKPSQFITWGTPPLTNPPVLEKVFTSDPSSAYLFKNMVSDKELQSLYEICFDARSAQGFLDFSSQFNKTDVNFREDFIKEFSTFSFKDEFIELEKFEGEVLFVHGANEKLINKEYLCENCFEYRVYPIIDAGHFAHQDNSDDFNINCLSFIMKKNKMNRVNIEGSY